MADKATWDPNEGPTWGDLSDSKYLSQDDLPPPPDGRRATIKKFTREQMPGREGREPEIKTILHFEEPGLKPMVLNATNRNIVKALTGADRPKDAIGSSIELHVDPTVSVGGRIVGGIRIRAPRP